MPWLHQIKRICFDSVCQATSGWATYPRGIAQFAHFRLCTSMDRSSSYFARAMLPHKGPSMLRSTSN
jgi:hypothetical protein